MRFSPLLATALAVMATLSAGLSAAIAQSSADAQAFGGFFQGAQGGYGDNLGLGDGAGAAPATNGNAATDEHEQHGVWFAGADRDLSGANFGSTGADSADLSYAFSGDSFESVRGRVGWASPTTMFFATAGYAWNDQSEGTFAGGIGLEGHDATVHGLIAGLGMEHRLNDDVSVRIEGAQYWMGDASGDMVGEETSVLHAGMLYRFGE